MKFEELHNDKETSDEYLLNTVKESLNKGEGRSGNRFIYD